MSDDDPIFHLALRGDWEDAVDRGEAYAVSTVGRSLADEGFIHCSFAPQVAGVAAAFYRERDDVLLLTIDPSAVGAPIRVEGGFPHIYGALPLAAVTAVDPFRPLPSP